MVESGGDGSSHLENFKTFEMANANAAPRQARTEEQILKFYVDDSIRLFPSMHPTPYIQFMQVDIQSQTPAALKCHFSIYAPLLKFSVLQLPISYSASYPFPFFCISRHCIGNILRLHLLLGDRCKHNIIL